MKLKYITLSLLFMGIASFGQVKTSNSATVNSSSNAFLDASENQGNQKGKGLLFPQTNLSTFKLNKSAADGINFPTYYDGMIVYNTHEGGNTTDSNIQTTENLEKGFYYFSNPTGKATHSIANGKWVRISDAQANASLWGQRQANGVTETYLKAADTNNDFVGYNSDKRFYFKLGQFNPSDFNNYWRYKGISKRVSGEVPFGTYITSDVIPLTTTLGYNNDLFYFTQNYSLLKENHVQANPNGLYFGDDTRLVTKGVNSNMQGATALNVRNDYYSNGNVGFITGLDARSTVGFENGDNSGTASNQHAANLTASVSKNAKSVTLKTLRVETDIHGASDYITGIQNYVRTKEQDEAKSYPTHTVKGMNGIYNSLIVSPNATVEGGIQGVSNEVNISEDVTMTGGQVIGSLNRIRLKSAIPNTYITVNRNTLNLDGEGLEAQAISLTQAVMYPILPSATTVAGDVIAFHFWNSARNNWTSTNAYGIKIDPISNGQTGNYGLYISDIEKESATGNYAIYTNKGNVRFGKLAGQGERVVVADANGILKTGDASSFSSKWVQNEGESHISLAVTSTGAPRVSTPGESGRNNVSIDDEGKVLAKGFVGYNGATIFPDYVFEKYYKGESAIKADYDFHNLSSVESYIKEKGHLPGYTSAKEIAEKGLIDLGATQLTNVEKIEELYLHTIEQEKSLKQKEAEISQLKSDVQELKSLVKQLLSK